MPIIGNSRLYLTNKNNFILNALSISQLTDLKWYAKGLHPDQVNDNVYVLRGFISESISKKLTDIKVNINQNSTPSTLQIDLSSVSITVDSNAYGSIIIGNGSQPDVTLIAGETFANLFCAISTGSLNMNPSIGSFYGKVILKYKVFDQDDNTETLSNEATCTIYFVPYPSLRITKIKSIESQNEIDSETGYIKYYNNLSCGKFLYKLSELVDITLTFSNSNFDNDINPFLSENEKIKNYLTNIVLRSTLHLNDKIEEQPDSDNDGIGNIYPAKILSTSLNGEEIIDIFNIITKGDLIFKGTSIKFNGLLRFSWLENKDVKIACTVTSEGVYNTRILFNTNRHSTFSTYTNIIADISLKVYDNKNKKIFGDVEIIGDIDMISDTTNNFITDKSIGYISSFRFECIPLIRLIKVTGRPSEESITVLDLTNTTYFKYSNTVIIENISNDIVYVETNRSGTTNENNLLYVTDEDTPVILEMGKKKVFIRVLFTPIVWEPSDDYVE